MALLTMEECIARLQECYRKRGYIVVKSNKAMATKPGDIFPALVTDMYGETTSMIVDGVALKFRMIKATNWNDYRQENIVCGFENLSLVNGGYFYQVEIVD